MHSEDAKPEKLPEPPSIGRRFSLYRYQWIAVPLLLLVPVVALFGTFDLKLERIRAQTSGVEVSVIYPRRIRYRQDATLDIVVRNGTGVPLDSVRIRLDTAYLGAFFINDFTPHLNDRHEVVLRNVVAGESRLIRGQLKAERYWSHAGAVHVQSSVADEPIDLRLQTLILP